MMTTFAISARVAFDELRSVIEECAQGQRLVEAGESEDRTLEVYEPRGDGPWWIVRDDPVWAEEGDADLARALSRRLRAPVVLFACEDDGPWGEARLFEGGELHDHVVWPLRMRSPGESEPDLAAWRRLFPSVDAAALSTAFEARRGEDAVRILGDALGTGPLFHWMERGELTATDAARIRAYGELMRGVSTFFGILETALVRQREDDELDDDVPRDAELEEEDREEHRPLTFETQMRRVLARRSGPEPRLIGLRRAKSR